MNWRVDQQHGRTRVAQHMARHGHPGSGGGDGLDNLYALGPADGGWPFGLAFAASIIGWVLGMVAGLDMWLALLPGGLLAAAVFAMGMRAVARIRRREAADAAEARSIREAEKERQLAEFRRSRQGGSE